MKRSVLVAPLAVSLFLFAACRDQQPLQPRAPAGPAALIMDGAHNGADRDFFFLPPIAPNPVLDPHFDPGAFNPNLSPTISICRLKTDLSDCEATILGPVAALVSPSEEQYKYLWDTKLFNLDVTRSYRVIVQLRSKRLGVLDVQPFDKGVKNARTGDFYPFQDDRTVPIKFRIEFHGLSCASGTDCGDGRITNDGGLVTTNTGFAGALFPPGWLPAGAVKAGITQVVVHIERILVNDADVGTSCLQSGLVEVEGCYRFTTEPDLHPGTFSAFVTTGICFEFPEEVGHDAPFQMHRREETNGQPSGPAAVALASARADFLTCDGFIPPGEIGSNGPRGLRELARSGWRATVGLVARMLRPRALYAVDLGAGGSTDGFSRFGWARPTAIAAFNTPLTQSAVVNATVPVSVQLMTSHHVPAPLVGAPVTFTLASAGGFLGAPPGTSGVSTTTGRNGVATVNWTLPSTAGTYTLEVASPGATGSPVTFTVISTAVGCDCWTSKASMPTARYALGVGTIDGILYAVGGFSPTAAVEAYDASSNTWTQKAPLPTARHRLAVGVVNGLLYAVGGAQGTAPVATVEAYDPVTNSWTSKASMPTARLDLAVGEVNGILYAVGGVSPDVQGVSTVEAYDPTTDTWTSKTSMPTPRFGLGVAAIGGKIYAVGGASNVPGGGRFATVEAYDPIANSWVTKAPMPAARYHLGVGAINGTLYAVGGFGGVPPENIFLTTVGAYDPTTDAWTTKASMPTARVWLSVGVAGGTLYAVGGAGPASITPLATVEAYQP